MVFDLSQDLVVRIVFILGNLTAKNNQAREQFSQEKGSIPTLLSLFRTFCKLDLHSQKRVGEAPEQPGAQRPPAQVQDVLVKLTRLLANLAIHPGVGQAMAASPHVVGLLLATLGKGLRPRLQGTLEAAPCSQPETVPWAGCGEGCISTVGSL